jgi:predicted acylesterase/phospholipase RssA
MKDQAKWGTLAARYEPKPQRRMLALDGGGIRGVLTLSFLKKIEQIVGQPLHEYFDYIAGTSTGAIIAAGLASGMTADQLIGFYRECGPEMFQRTRFLDRLRSLYQNGALEQKLKSTFGVATDLRLEGVKRPDGGAGKLKTLLLVVTRNVTTDSPWPISANPDACYSDPTRPDSNVNMRLWQLVRASTAAPIYFPPEVIECEPGNPRKSFVFVDGGVTPYNNPAFLLYRFATDPAYNLNWEGGEDKLLLISVGTGASATTGATADDPESNMLATGVGIPSALMYGALIDQDINCRAIGRCVYGAEIDRELLDMVPRTGPASGGYDQRRARPLTPLAQNTGRQFLYARYNVDLSEANLRALAFDRVDPKSVQKMDNATSENIETLLAVGAASAKQVQRDHFGAFV